MDNIGKSNKSSVSKKIRELRIENDFSQVEIAKRLNISQQTYSNYERKNSPIDSDTLIAICNLYGVTSDYLLGIEKKPKQELSSIVEVAHIVELVMERMKKK